jgi:hypothetical protein
MASFPNIAEFWRAEEDRELGIIFSKISKLSVILENLRNKVSSDSN